MIRRLVFSLFTLASIGAAAAQQTPPPQYPVPPRAVIPYTQDVIDYRPAINGPDDRIVFERQVLIPATTTSMATYSPTINLYISNLVNPQPQMFVTNLPSMTSTTRPDWCYVPGRPNYDGPIVFTEGNTGPILIKSSQPGPVGAPIPNTGNTIYPTWYPGCGSLALYAIDALTAPSKLQGPTLLGTSTTNGTPARHLTGSTVWAGFSSINPISPYLIAFAGQPFNITDTTTSNCPTGYQQDCNYVYLAADTTDGVQVHPIDAGASVNMYSPQYQGRAPSWSPDGRWIAFESNRACGKLGLSFYAIFIQDTLHPTPARQVTDCKWNAQHAKWYHQRHGGRQLLITTVVRYPYASIKNIELFNARTISSLDVTAFVTDSSQN